MEECRVYAQAFAPLAVPVGDPISGGPLPGLREPQYGSILQIDKARWGRWGRWEGEPNARSNFRGVMARKKGNEGAAGAHDDDAVEAHGAGAHGGDKHDDPDAGDAVQVEGKTGG